MQEQRPHIKFYNMNKTEMVQTIADKAKIDIDIVAKVMDTCEEVLAEVIKQKYGKFALEVGKQFSHKEEENAKIIQFSRRKEIGHKTN